MSESRQFDLEALAMTKVAGEEIVHIIQKLQSTICNNVFRASFGNGAMGLLNVLIIEATNIGRISSDYINKNIPVILGMLSTGKYGVVPNKEEFKKAIMSSYSKKPQTVTTYHVVALTIGQTPEICNKYMYKMISTDEIVDIITTTSLSDLFETRRRVMIEMHDIISEILKSVVINVRKVASSISKEFYDDMERDFGTKFDAMMQEGEAMWSKIKDLPEDDLKKMTESCAKEMDIATDGFTLITDDKNPHQVYKKYIENM